MLEILDPAQVIPSLQTKDQEDGKGHKYKDPEPNNSRGGEDQRSFAIFIFISGVHSALLFHQQLGLAAL